MSVPSQEYDSWFQFILCIWALEFAISVESVDFILNFPLNTMCFVDFVYDLQFDILLRVLVY